MSLKDFTEDQLIEQIKSSVKPGPNTIIGIGDDCAVLHTDNPEIVELFKTDSVVENVHFTRDMGAKRIGYKAAARVFSDMAAMAGAPTELLVTLILPSSVAPEWILELYSGINSICDPYGVGVVGGETTQSPCLLYTSDAADD